MQNPRPSRSLYVDCYRLRAWASPRVGGYGRTALRGVPQAYGSRCRRHQSLGGASRTATTLAEGLHIDSSRRRTRPTCRTLDKSAREDRICRKACKGTIGRRRIEGGSYYGLSARRHSVVQLHRQPLYGKSRLGRRTYRAAGRAYGSRIYTARCSTYRRLPPRTCRRYGDCSHIGRELLLQRPYSANKAMIRRLQMKGRRVSL